MRARHDPAVLAERIYGIKQEGSDMVKTHDQFCRCRACKPAHPDNRHEGWGWFLLAVLLLWCVAFAVSVCGS